MPTAGNPVSRFSLRPAAFLVCALLTGLAPPPACAAAPAPAVWLANYLLIDTTNPPGDEAAAARFLARILHRYGIATRTFFHQEGRASVYARIDGRRADGALLLLHHLDVVPAGEGWSRDPFAAEVVDGELWGRGAIDAKSLGIAHLVAFLALAEAGEELERDVIFLAVADEENGGGGTAWLWRHHPELFVGVGGVLGEGGIAKQVNGRLLWWGVETAQKRPLWLEVRARGRAGHASGLNPGNAVHTLVAALARLDSRQRRWKVTAPVRRYLRALAPLHQGATAERFADPDAWVGPAGPRGPMAPGQANLFLDSVQITVLKAGERINVVPSLARARIDVRLLPDTDAESFLAELRESLGPHVDVEVLLDSPAAAASPVDGRLYHTLETVLGPEAPVVPAFIAGFTDSRFFRARGVPTYGVTPFALEPQLLRGIHGVDERIPVEELLRGVERMKEIVRVYAQPVDDAGR